MKYIYLLLSILIYTSAISQEDWQDLLTDEKLSTFKKLNGAAEFVYKNGVLTGFTKPNTPNTFLATKKHTAISF